jgi:RHS repeat-associated protein
MSLSLRNEGHTCTMRAAACASRCTGKERDTESGNDYFGARYYASSMGRWMSPDPSMESEILELPQTWNRYSYVYDRPLYATDPDGRCPPCIGAIVGGVVGGLAEGGWNLGSQLVSNHGDLGAVHWSDVGANALGGLVAGALAGATGGGSLLADAAIGAGANVVGGVVTRTAQGDDASEVFSASDVSTDALAGFVGGGAGHIAADVVHVPEDPGPRPRTNGRRKLEKWNAKTADRNFKIGANVGIGTASGSPIGHTAQRYGSSLWSWFFPPQPDPPPPPAPPCFRTSTDDGSGHTSSSGCQ